MEFGQRKVGDVYDLTPEGVREIQAHDNDYNEISAPINSDKRDWRTKDIANLWIGMIVSIAVYQVASGLLVSGMSWVQALVTIILGHTIVMGVAIALGHFGTKYGMNYPMLSKLVFGPKGMIFPSLIRGVLGIFWFGVQAWIGGQAVFIIINAIYPAWSTYGFMTQFISFLIFWMMNVYIAASGSKAVKILEGVSAPILLVLSLIVIIWGFGTAKWNLHTLLNVPVLQAKGSVDFWSLFWPALSAMIAFDGGIALSMPDFTRHCVDQKSQSLGQIISAPIMTGYIAFVGICGTAGGFLAFGKEIWEPAILVGNFNSVVIRIVFSLFIIMAVLTTNVAGNLIPPVNIVATLLKGKLDYKWVAVLTAVFALFARPWDSLSSAYNLIFNVTQFLGALLGPISGLYLVAYLIAHHTDIDMVDAYKINGGRYYYTKGWNVPVIVLFLVFTAIIFISKSIEGLNFIFNNAYVYGVVVTGLVYYVYIKITQGGK
ncbi:NCS1 family nucleobase:cation symporter-1 [Peptoniphilus equinus]|uniref:NCS1 family nucleobase:cation symporter-1 n=1 Tax=Peptoniphilus equinus TaxID=3016343 RepID=A0ABY7QSW9_9FIRM|nr:NCS1 family nucleobase:cation symporter-1 [Peptoniphilus equinus]WBW49869.1 NCS1 family nucleobase:cation symporter-1 [Peptoniphilus equinus]